MKRVAEKYGMRSISKMSMFCLVLIPHTVLSHSSSISEFCAHNGYTIFNYSTNTGKRIVDRPPPPPPKYSPGSNNGYQLPNDQFLEVFSKFIENDKDIERKFLNTLEEVVPDYSKKMSNDLEEYQNYVKKLQKHVEEFQSANLSVKRNHELLLEKNLDTEQ